jgi:pimeloyl-ACP methyl ester carboxylesterase
MATGTPPVAATAASMASGFRTGPHMALTGQRTFTDAEALAYAQETCGEPFEPFLLDAARRADGRAREIMFATAAAGLGADQLHIAMTCPRPLAIVTGGAEPFVNNHHLKSIAYANLWEGAVHVLGGLGHAPFRQAPDRFDPILARFLDAVLPA